EMYSDALSGSTIYGINEAKSYRLNATTWLVGTTLTDSVWDIRTISASSDLIQGEGYEESLVVALARDNTIGNDGVINIACDSLYKIYHERLYVNSDSDCNNWLTYDTDGSTAARSLTYASGQERLFVHAPDYTLYNIHVSLATGDATEYYAKILYQGTEVDISYFDSTDNVQLSLLYGQCYTLQYLKVLDNSVADSSTICADDVAFKEDIINTELGFTFWSAPWGASHSYNSTSHILITIVHHTPIGYNYTVNIINGTGDIIVTQTFSNVTTTIDNNIFNVT